MRLRALEPVRVDDARLDEEPVAEDVAEHLADAEERVQARAVEARRRGSRRSCPCGSNAERRLRFAPPARPAARGGLSAVRSTAVMR